MKKKFTDFPLLEKKNKTYPLFYPYISKSSIKTIQGVLKSRWIGQGPLVDKFENVFQKKFAKNNSCIAVGSGTDALHLSFILANIKKDDEVICPVFTCTATNIPLLYIGAKIKFVDIDPLTMNISIDHLKKIVSKKTKAIIFVNYGGIPANLKALNQIKKKYNLLLIQDAAQSLGSKYKKKNITNYSDFTIFSFQAIKHITSGDGGLLCFKNKKLLNSARRIRWFGIDRIKKQGGTWENDITEIGYKYQMTDIAAAMGIAALSEFDEQSQIRKALFQVYEEELAGCERLRIIGSGYKDREHAAWLFTIIVEERYKLQEKLRDNNIESNQVHFRNDRYSIFKEFTNGKVFPNMDKIEDDYLVLPLHTKMTVEDARRVCSVIKSGW